MAPLYSIIIPLYNAEKFIQVCVNCVLNQSISDYEVLLINDGSTDNSMNICNSIASTDNRIKVIHKQNAGVSSARNVGLKEATGKWICFLDVDDYINNNYLENFNIQDDNDIGLYAQGYIIEKHSYSMTTKLPTKSGSFNVITGYEILEDSNIINSPVFKLYKREIINKYNIKFDERLSFGEDHLFSMDYLLHINKIEIRSVAGYVYCMNEGSLTKRHLNLEKMLLYMQLFAKRYFLLNTVGEPHNNRAYSLRQYSNIKRFLLESRTQKKEFIRLRNTIQELNPYIKKDGLNFCQKTLIEIFILFSKLLSYKIGFNK